MVSSATTNIPILSLPPFTTKSRGFNHIASGYLSSIVQAYDHNCTDFFDNNYIKIFKSEEVNINVLCPPII